jgi:hypothetical protein
MLYAYLTPEVNGSRIYRGWKAAPTDSNLLSLAHYVPTMNTMNSLRGI